MGAWIPATFVQAARSEAKVSERGEFALSPAGSRRWAHPTEDGLQGRCVTPTPVSDAAPPRIPSRGFDPREPRILMLYSENSSRLAESCQKILRLHGLLAEGPSGLEPANSREVTEGP